MRRTLFLGFVVGCAGIGVASTNSTVLHDPCSLTVERQGELARKEALREKEQEALLHLKDLQDKVSPVEKSYENLNNRADVLNGMLSELQAAQERLKSLPPTPLTPHQEQSVQDLIEQYTKELHQLYFAMSATHDYEQAKKDREDLVKAWDLFLGYFNELYGHHSGS